MPCFISLPEIEFHSMGTRDENMDFESRRELSLDTPATLIAQPSGQDSNRFSNVVDLFSDKPARSELNNDASVLSRLMREAQQLDW